MEKFAILFNKSNAIMKAFLIILVMFITTLLMYVLYSAIFFLLTVLHEGAFLVSSLIGLLFILIAIIKYPPKRKEK